MHGLTGTKIIAALFSGSRILPGFSSLAGALPKDGVRHGKLGAVPTMCRFSFFASKKSLDRRPFKRYNIFSKTTE